MTYGAAAAMVASFLLAQSPSAVRPPDGVAYEDDLDRYVWVSADSVMTPDGAIKDLEHWRAYPGAFLENALRYKLDQARTLFGPDHARGLAHGTIPPESLCIGHRSATMEFAGPETDHFEITAMLSEVIAEATVTGFSLGFFVMGQPGALLTLEDVRPLREGSPIPEAILVPVPRLMVRGGVFCGDVLGSTTDHIYEPRIGTRVVFMGRWHSSGLVLLNPLGGNGAFAEVDRGKLKWSHLTAYEPPDTRDAFLDLLDGMRRRGLMAMSLEAARKGADPREREDFLSDLRTRYGRGPDCRLLGAEMVEGEWVLNHTCTGPARPEH